MPNITPKKLLNYKRGLVAKKNAALAAFQDNNQVDIPDTIKEENDDEILANKVVTSAEVLPTRHEFNEDDLNQLEQELFQDNNKKLDPFSSR